MRYTLFLLVALLAIICSVSAVKFERPAPASNDNCGTCQFVVTYLEKVINSTEKQIEQEALLLCESVPQQYKMICTSAVQMYLPSLLKKIETEDPKLVCCWLSTKVYPFCDQQTCNAHANVNKFKANEYCATCKMVVQMAESYLQNATLRAQIKQVIEEKGCSLLPDQYASMCKIAVEAYFDQLLNEILANYTPDRLCGAVGLCVNQTAVSVENPLSFLVSDIKKADSGAVCQYCQLAVTVVESFLKDQQKRAQIKQFLINEGCKALPGSFSAVCTAIVNTEFDNLVDSILAKFTAAQVCQQLNVCPKSFAQKGAQFEFCPICVYGVDTAEKMLLTKKPEIQQMLDTKVCKAIPNQMFSSVCSTIVYGKYDEIVALLMTKYNGKQLCSLIGFCASNNISQNAIRFN